MKILIFILLLSIPFIGFGQLEGKYELVGGYWGEGIIFYNDGTFDYEKSDCFSYEKGFGQYYFKDSILTLDFITPKDSLNYLFQVYVNKETISNDSIIVTVNVLDVETKKPLVNASIQKWDSREYHKYDNFNTDSTGQIVLKITKSDEPVHFTTTTEDAFDEDTFSIIPDKNCKITLHLASFTLIETGRQEKFIIKAIKEEGLLMGQYSLDKTYYLMYYKPEFWRMRPRQ